MKTRFKEKADLCGICLEEIEFQGKIDCCLHLFCVNCINKWSDVIYIQSENTCPICKSRFGSIVKLPKRKEYKKSKQKARKIKNKNQERSLSQSEFVMLLQAASNILTTELHALLEDNIR
jgi:uncharacterized CHY-type Zn-finger protein